MTDRFAYGFTNVEVAVELGQLQNGHDIRRGTGKCHAAPFHVGPRGQCHEQRNAGRSDPPAIRQVDDKSRIAWFGLFVAASLAWMAAIPLARYAAAEPDAASTSTCIRLKVS